MDHNALYAFPYSQPRQKSPSTVSNRPAGAYQNSSAFSASANPDEDWTKISDLAERRRIQNRIAQRNYRKKLKRRLEDLEKRTSSSSVSPEQVPREIVQSSEKSLSVPTRSHVQRRSSRSSAVSTEEQYSPEIFPNEEYWSEARPATGPSFSFAYSAPVTYAYPDYTPQAEYFPGNDYQNPEYQQIHTMYGNTPAQANYPQATSPPLPSMGPYNNYKSETQYGSSEAMTPFDMSYASLAGVSVHPHGLMEHSLRTPPLTDSASYNDSSRECSPSYFGRSLTSDSEPTSPALLL